MKKICLLLLCSLFLVSCGGNRAVKSSQKPAPPVASKPLPSKPLPSKPSTSTPTAPSAPAPSADSSADAQIGDNSKKPGGYYLDDGPDANPPPNIDSIPDATPKNEPLLARFNKPYKALGQTYSPMTTSQDYKVRGIASWYGKRFHGKKTSSGEIYDMYAMSAAHTTLPLPSYAKVTNPANGRSVIVRVNDRGPFKSTRIIDLSYAAAYKLRLVNQGSGLVEVEAIHPDKIAQYTQPNTQPSQTNIAPATSTANAQTSDATTTPADTANALSAQAATLPVQTVNEVKPVTVANQQASEPNNSTTGLSRYFIQAGAFKNEVNAEAFKDKIQGLQIEQNAGIYRVYNDGLHRILLGPYDTKVAAEQVAATIRKQLNTATFITNQQQ